MIVLGLYLAVARKSQVPPDVELGRGTNKDNPSEGRGGSSDPISCGGLTLAAFADHPQPPTGRKLRAPALPEAASAPCRISALVGEGQALPTKTP